MDIAHVAYYQDMDIAHVAYYQDMDIAHVAYYQDMDIAHSPSFPSGLRSPIATLSSKRSLLTPLALHTSFI